MSGPQRLVLASASPRRQEILRFAGIPFTTRIAGIPEDPLPDETPLDHVRRLAGEKAATVPTEPGELILAADTVVLLDSRILGKPAGEDEARLMLALLSGREHEVITGICLKHESMMVVDTERTRVRFVSLTEPEIAEYVASGEPMDKAGAYGIQGRASKFIDRIEGCYFNVVGLPIALVYKHLKAIGFVAGRSG
jgi:septum formation protein